jgi:acetyl esterase/lipase
VALAALLCAPAVAHAGKPAPDAAPKAKLHEVQRIAGICYHEVRDDPGRYRHELDVYRPKGKGPWPVLFFVHGGGWMIGSKDDVFGVYGYGTIARCLAQRGLVVVLPNYRLSPGVKHPEHVKDVARAFAWACRNARKYGGQKGPLFVGGHSAGGHLAALLATDETYLKQVGRSRKNIGGVIAVSGIYRVDDLDFKLAVGDPGQVLRLNVNVRPFAMVFGGDAEVAKQASPINHIQKGLPPFLVLSAAFDYPPLWKMAREFTAALKEKDCDVQAKVIPWRTHETMLFDIPERSIDRATAQAIMDFINEHHRQRAAEGPTGKSIEKGKKQ